MNTIEDQSIAIAGLLQCARLIHQLAYTGKVEHERILATQIRSLFNFDPKDTADTFGGVHELNLGFETFLKLLSGGDRQPSDTEMIRYSVNLINVTKAFLNEPDMVKKVFTRLEALKPALTDHGVDDGLMTDINQLYRETISNLPVRVVINGEKRYLEEPRISNQIRSLLLAAIRATVLWRQVGGNRWSLVLKRGKYLAAARQLSIGHN
ncbi:MAG: lysogenization regulator HflD [Halothiobacillus sp. 24-54-40]|jgi:high frequency lysogenization protein|nr:MAG: lysogenization regulator HflD [Halothiobacillus sp. 35-54-62]OYY52108.1 MAG: lysogenization regulator HflD [Halothiobacillus sp. 28-55-5]OYZ88416.1 MAG: lysogenization regulator HflD [Halothiobacillus sp. 24-54-40]OZA81724.1 MAG: lysogenization regulator HflD [Halothiobacillus sp. 39-53-45]HQS01778.1 high frequency lysogenization protein HflD [Halothiobacillus sp.]